MLESIYVECLVYELKKRGLKIKTEVSIPLVYNGVELSKRFRMDILVENEIIIEVKAIETILLVHGAQIISHLKLANKRLGFLINFNVPILIKGFKRFVNKF
ncbi:MAG: GxxExxY protein [Bacteroidota bacterium]|nr:GxxExxY protein [Bacteroidota bacterium]